MSSPSRILRPRIKQLHVVVRASPTAALRRSLLLIIRYACQDIGEPGFRIDVAELGMAMNVASLVCI